MKLRAFYMTLKIMPRMVYTDFIDACPHLEHFQYVSEKPDKSGELRYIVMNRPTKRLIIADVSGFDADIPSGIETVEVVVSGNENIIYFGDVLGKKYQAVRFVKIFVRPGCEVTEQRIIASEFFARCVPKWTEQKTLEQISLNTAGLVVKVSRPNELMAQGLNEIRVTVNNIECIPEQWNCPADHFISVTYSTKARDFNSDIGFDRLTSAPQIHSMHFKRSRLLRLFLDKLAQLDTTEFKFTGLVKLSGIVNVELDLSGIPYVQLDRLGSLEEFFLQQKNQPFAQVEAEKCHDASIEHVPMGMNGFCFHNEIAQEA